MKVYIPSKWRCWIMKTHNLFDFKDVYIFVEPQDYDEYIKYYPEYNIINIQKDNMWVWYVRKFMIDYCNEEIVCILDDDFEWFFEWKKKVEWTDVLEYIWKKIISENLWIWWLFCKNMQWTKTDKEWHYKSKFFSFWVFNIKLLKSNWINYDDDLRLFEDIDLLIQILNNWLSYVCSSKYFFETFSYKQRIKWTCVWWCTSDWKVDRSKNAVEYLVKKWWDNLIKEKIDKDWYYNFRTNRKLLWK